MARNVDIIIGKDVNGSGRSLILSTSPILAFSISNNILFFRIFSPRAGIRAGVLQNTQQQCYTHSITTTGGGSGGEESLVRVCYHHSPAF